MAMGSLMLGIVKRMLIERGGSNHNCSGSNVDGKSGSMDERLMDPQRVVERDERDQDNAEERMIPTRGMEI